MPITLKLLGGRQAAKVLADVGKSVEETAFVAMQKCAVKVRQDAKLNATASGGERGGRNPRTGPKSLRRDSGMLVSQITHEVRRGPVRGFVGFIKGGPVYAGIHEYGGTITAKGGALAVPVHKDARGKSPREFGDLVMIKRKGSGKPPLLIRRMARGRQGQLSFMEDIMYVLMKSVKIPERPYLRPALEDNEAFIEKEFFGTFYGMCQRATRAAGKAKV